MESLPEECLDLILHSIPPHRPLHSLLLVSRTFFRLAVPILYQNPFDYIDRLFSHHNANQRKVMVLSLLILSSPEPLFEGLTLKQGGWLYRNPATVDYLSYYTRHSAKHIQNIISQFVLNSDSTTQQTSSLSAGGRSTIPPSPPPSSSGTMSIKERIHRGLVGHAAAHIQSLCFSMHKLGALIPLVPQLSSLARLELFMSNKGAWDMDAQRFIASHLQHHPRILREIKIDATYQIGGLYIAAHVEALGAQAQVIDVTGWSNGIWYLDRFPSEACRSLLLRLTVSPKQILPQGLPQMVRRFGKLEKIRIPAVDAGLFAWAVDGSDVQDGETVQRPRVLPPLASLDLQGPDDQLIPALSDATNAFRATITDIKGLSSFGESMGKVLEWDWSLPRLTHVDLEGTVAVRFNLLSLQHCPALRELRLNIGRQIPETWVPAVKAQELAESLARSQVTRLELSGYWDVSDADLTQQEPMLTVLRRLTKLNLMWCRGPTISTFEFLMREMRALQRLHVSGTLAEKERLLGLTETLGLDISLDIDTRG